MKEYIKPNVELKIDNALKAMNVKFLAFIDFDDFKQLVAFEYKAIEEHQLKKALIDLRKIPVYAPGMTDYIHDEWFPRVSNLGLKYIAFIVPGSTLGKLSMEKAHSETKEIEGIVVTHFTDEDSARSWLESV